MTQVGTSTAASNAKARLTDADVREVSTVDRPAIGEPFLMIKSEDGMAKPTGVRKEEVQDAAPKRPAADAEPQPPPAQAAAHAEQKDENGNDDGGEATLVLPPDAKAAIVAGLTAARARLDDMLAEVSAAEESADAEVPGENLVKILDVAGGLAKTVEPYATGGIVDDTEKAAWSTADIDKLPDSSFLHIEAGGKKDAEGKTEPRSLRHFPVKDAAGKVDLPHLRNAIDQAPKSTLPEEVKTKVQADGRKLLEETAKASGVEVAKAGTRCTWTPEYINSLCDWDFLYVEPGTDRDTDYHTLPLTNRHFPIRDHAGRLCLSAVLDAIDVLAAPSPALTPWLTESRRVELLLRLADARQDEVAISIRRDGMTPESAAELAAIAEMLELVAQSGAATAEPPAAVAPVAEAAKANENAHGSQPMLTGGTGEAAQPKTPPTVPEMGATVAKAAGQLSAVMRAVAKGDFPKAHAEAVKACIGPMMKAMGHFDGAKDHLEKMAKGLEQMGAAHTAMKALAKAVDPYFTGEMDSATGEPVFGTPPVAGAPNPTGATAEVKPGDTGAMPADAKKAVEKAQADAAAAKTALAKAQADNVALKQRVAKAERQVPQSNVNRAEPVVKSDPARNEPPLSLDLNEIIKAEEAAKRSSSAQR